LDNMVYEVTVLKMGWPFIKKLYISTDSINEAITEGNKHGLVHKAKLHSCLYQGEYKFFT
jgi:hypothetical protein